MRVLMFNINRDPKKSKVLQASEIAPDLFTPQKVSEPDERQILDDLGAELFGNNTGFGSAY